MSKFTINSDMLGVVYFLARMNGPQVGCSGDAWELREIAEQLPADRWEHHLVILAFEHLGSTGILTLCAWVAGNLSLTPQYERWLRDNGFLYGAEPKLPKAVVKHCQWWQKSVLEAKWG